MASETATVRLASAQPVPARIPAHIGVIMDGNGRWAKARNLPRTEGHRAGIKSLRLLVELAIRHGVSHVSVFSFSSENWSRPRDEVAFIFNLMRRFVASDLERLVANNVRVRIVGERDGLGDDILKLIAKAEADTSANTGLCLTIAFNYGAKAELTAATRTIAADVAAGRLRPEDITEDTIASRLYWAGLPDPDLILRTSGEQRLSNFMLWQSAYAEFVFLDEHWPDLSEDIFLRALDDFANRKRRFGGIEAR